MWAPDVRRSSHLLGVAMVVDADSRWMRIVYDRRPERFALRWPEGPQSPSPGAAGPIFLSHPDTSTGHSGAA